MNERIQVEALSLMASEDPRHMIEYAEKKYHHQFAHLAVDIANTIEEKRFVLIAGPSASGKTFSSHILSEHLQKNKVRSRVISLDNFYKDRDEMPKLLDGESDYESLESLDLECLQSCVIQLLEKGSTKLPHFSFKIGKRSRTERMTLEENEVLILEGIHALNPALLPKDLQRHFHKYFITTQSEYESVDGKLLLTAKDIRLMRRMIRDFHHRNSTVSETLALWKKVLEGERHWIFPYIEQAEKKIDSTHIYEPMLYRSIMPALFEEKMSDENRKICDDLLSGLSHFDKIDPKLVPENSLLIEFIG